MIFYFFFTWDEARGPVDGGGVVNYECSVSVYTKMAQTNLSCVCRLEECGWMTWLWSLTVGCCFVLFASFQRYGDLLAKNIPIFATPLSFGALTPYVPFGILR